ncbi:rRNA-processing protein [Saccharomycopsis crataegensis]|uniref:Protein BFR2 n=1 Tax=Saccharomycopsis crataegensis TaxID=43959 RepID=A0AAV5QRX5_9ASCO|nr:rRNA-processing protein [Saccharomycopsis crataegensis]
MAKKKTLSQEFADLLKPQTFDYDIEDSERIDADDDENNQSSGDEDDELKKQHYVKMSKSKLRKDELNVNDAKYKGDTISRKDLYGSVGNNIDENASEDNESDDNESEDNNEEGEESDSGVDLSAESSDEEQEQSDDEEDHNDEGDEHKRDKIKALMNTETQSDSLKGHFVLQQQSLYDSIVDSRIKFHKGLSTYNQFPQTAENVKKFSDEKTEKYIKKTESALFSLMDAVLELRLAMYKKDKIVKQDKEMNNKKRSLDSYLQESEVLDNTLQVYRNAVLTKWSQKVQSASGSAALNASKFKAVNQTAAVQVENNLSNMERLLKRTKLNRRNVKPLGYVPPESDSSTKKAAFDPLLQENDKIFDDEDFYRLLLRDLIDKKVSNSASTSEANIITLSKVNKFKKNVDTKASKGRKLNYKVQEQLQNYMAPKFEAGRWDDYQIDEFFAGLLGQKINMNEDDDEDRDDEKVEEATKAEEEALANDDIKLFG